MRNAIVFIIDGLGTGAIGPYGNTQVETPALNRFASESVLVEHVLIDSPDLARQYRSFLHGGHAAFSDQHYQIGGRYERSLPERLREHSIRSRFISNKQTCQALDSVDCFDEKIELEIDPPSRLAATPDQTWMASFFSTVLEILDAERDGAVSDAVDESKLTWIHCPGMSFPWDAPYDFRTLFVDEDDPDPPTFVESPQAFLGENPDPDELLKYACAYNGQMLILDMILELILNAIDDSTSETLVVIAGARGFPLGEHGSVGFERSMLQAELLQVPLMLRFPTTRLESARYLHLVQSGDLHATLSNWFELDKSALIKSPLTTDCDLRIAETDLDHVHRQVAFAVNDSEIAVRTPCWFARCFGEPKSLDDAAPWCQLYLKPDDRWNFSDVSSRCPEVVADLFELVKQIPGARLAGDFQSLNIPDSLMNRPE